VHSILYIHKHLFIIFFVSEPTVVMQTNDQPFRTCLNFGRSFYRTFDGLEFQFAGTCTYTLAENTDEAWHVEMTVKNCNYWSTCKKVENIQYDLVLSHMTFYIHVHSFLLPLHRQKHT